MNEWLALLKSRSNKKIEKSSVLPCSHGQFIPVMAGDSWSFSKCCADRRARQKIPGDGVQLFFQLYTWPVPPPGLRRESARANWFGK